jgi:hypothetical protein
MKKTFYTLIALLVMALLPQSAFADPIDHGAPLRMWTVPTVFSVDEPVTFYFDMTDTGFKEGVDLYLWCWNPTEPDAGHWENSSDFAKLTYVGDNVYSMTITPTKYFSNGTGKTEQDIYNTCQTDDWPGFWCRLKTKDGSEESGVFQAPDSRATWKEFAASGEACKFYSTSFTGNTLTLTDKFTLNRALTIVFNPDLFTVGSKSMTEFAKQSGFGGFKLHSGLNDWTFLQGVKVWIPGCMSKTDIHKLTNGYYTISMTSPYDYYSWNYADDGSQASTNLAADEQIDNLAWLMVGIQNNDWGGTSANQTTKAGSAEVYPDPQFSFFPTKVSKEDIITFIRKYNGKRDGELTWTLTAGSKTFTGKMDGSRDKRQGAANLLKELAGTNVSSMTLTITNAAGTTLVSTDIPLVTVDE